jgi:hypothetical protein
VRKFLAPAILGLMLAVVCVSVAAASSSPYPSKLKMQAGLLFSKTAHDPPPWGAALTAAQVRWVTIKSAGPRYRWGVWEQDGGPPTFPVRSLNGGVTWRVAGPQLATDWAGGSLYYVYKVFPEGSSAVVMVSDSVVDVTTNNGRQWYQYMNPASDWTITAHAVSTGIGLRVGPTADKNLPKGSYANYVLNVAHHQWIRASESLH